MLAVSITGMFNVCLCVSVYKRESDNFFCKKAQFSIMIPLKLDAIYPNNLGRERERERERERGREREIERERESKREREREKKMRDLRRVDLYTNPKVFSVVGAKNIVYFGMHVLFQEQGDITL